MMITWKNQDSFAHLAIDLYQKSTEITYSDPLSKETNIITTGEMDHEG
jgi:hypothetical protein